MRKTDVRLRFLSLFIALILFITQTLTITAFAQGETPTAEQYFTFDSSTGTITAYNNAGGSDVVIPSTIGGIAVKKLFKTFNLNSVVKSVVIPEGVTDIGNDAFGASSVTTVVIPCSVTTIESAAFSISSIKNVTINSSVMSIDINAFEYSGAAIEHLKDAYEAGGVGIYNLNGSTWIHYIVVGDLKYKVLTEPSGGVNGTVMLVPNSYTGTSYTVPAILDNPGKRYNVTSIESKAFYNCSQLTSIILPNTLTSIGDSTFNQCKNLTEITIPDGVTSIEKYTFWDCEKLKSVTLPKNLTAIREEAFELCTALTNITIPNQVTVIEKEAFRQSGLIRIIFSGSQPPAFGTSSVFMYLPQDLRVIVPSGAVADYQKISNIFPNNTFIEEYPGTFPIVNNVSLNPPSTTITRGDGNISCLIYFSATVTGTNNPSHTVTWKISGNNSNNTQISASGVMLVATDEKAGSITVTATSTTDTTKSGTSTVTIYSSKNKILLSITPCKAITNIASGTGKTASALGLPSTVDLVTDNGNVQAHVDWNISASTYNPTVTTQQTFTVNGNVTLPSGVANTNNVILTTHIDVTVNAAFGGNTDNKTITGFIVDYSTKSVPYGTDFASLNLPDKFKAVGNLTSDLWIKVTGWVCNTYNSTVPGSYNVKAVLDTGYKDSGYVLGSGVSAPEIKVTVAAKEKPSDNGGSNHHNNDNSSSKTPAAPTVAADTLTGATADLSGIVLPSGVTGVNLNVTKKEPSNKSDKQASDFSRTLLANPKAGVIGNPVVYNMELLDQNGVVTSGTGKVKITLPVPSGLRGTPHVLHFEPAGTFTDMGAKVENGMLVFESDRLGYFAVAGIGDSITLDTTSYTMPVNGNYEIGLRVTGTQGTSVKVHSTNDRIAKVVQLKNGNYQVNGTGTGTAYIMFDVYDSKNKLLTHASVMVTVQNGVKTNGNSARQIGIY